MNSIEHGKERAGRITASVASIIMSGSPAAWATLRDKLWADDGSEFAAASTGARAHGHEWEETGVALWWSDHPGREVNKVGLVRMKRGPLMYRRLLGASPDREIIDVTGIPVRWGGMEVKSPTTREKHEEYAERLSRKALPAEHRDQVMFSLFVTQWPRWVFLSHFGGGYSALTVDRSEVKSSGWLALFQPRLDAFIEFYLKDREPKVNRHRTSDVLAMLKGAAK